MSTKGEGVVDSTVKVDSGAVSQQDIDSIYANIWTGRSPARNVTGMERLQFERQNSCGEPVTPNGCDAGRVSYTFTPAHFDSSQLPHAQVGEQYINVERANIFLQDSSSFREFVSTPERAEHISARMCRSAIEARKDGYFGDYDNRARIPSDLGYSRSTISFDPYRSFSGPGYYDRGPSFGLRVNLPFLGGNVSIGFGDHNYRQPWDERIGHGSQFGPWGNHYRSHRGLRFADNRHAQFFNGSQIPEGMQFEFSDREILRPHLFNSESMIGNPRTPEQEKQEKLEKQTQKVCYPDGSSRVVHRDGNGNIDLVINPDGSRLLRQAIEPGKEPQWKAYSRYNTPIVANNFRGTVEMTPDDTFRMSQTFPVPQTYEQKCDGSYSHQYKGGASEQFARNPETGAFKTVKYTDGKLRRIAFSPDNDGILQTSRVQDV